jgi:hypothetical protein
VNAATGRPADCLAEHASAPGVRYLGLYGLQEIRDGQVRVDPRLEAGRPAVQAAQRDLRDHAAVRSAEAPERLLANADLVVDGPPGPRDFLERLTARPGSS